MIETNIHFPTDINLTWDCGRKCLDTLRHLENKTGPLPGWRQLEDWSRKLKRHYRKCANIHRKKGQKYQERLKGSTEKYLSCCRKITTKVADILAKTSTNQIKGNVLLLTSLEHYKRLLDKHIDLVNRRILKGEKIPHCEKMFSIFEPHTEWLNKGKLHKNVELGLSTVIATDHHQFILHHWVVQKTTDHAMTIPVAEYLCEHYADYNLKSISFDRGFYSLNAKQVVSKLFEKVILPKSGKKSLKQIQEESEASFVALKKQHSAVEANINQLEHHGVNRCPDKGLFNFKRYVALGVVAYNLHQLGNLLR